MQYAPMNTASRADLIEDLTCLRETRPTHSLLAELAARSGFWAAVRAYDAGLTTPVLVLEPAE